MSVAALPAIDPGAADAWYRIGDGYLSVGGDHQAFRATVEEIFGGCRASPPGDDRGLPHVHCVVRVDAGCAGAVIDLVDDDRFSLHAFTLGAFADRGYVDGPAMEGGWQTIATAAAPEQPVLAINGDRVVADDVHRWEGLMANLAIGRLMSRQSGCMFFHAATVAVRGHGLMLCGNKRSGKTTIALALAARGHPLLGDEIAAVRLASRGLLPVRRALGVRDGPSSSAAAARLAAVGGDRVTYPDGETRLRVQVESAFPQPVPREVPIGAIVLLDGFAEVPELEALGVGSGARRILTPLAATLWGPVGGARTMQLLRLLGATPGYILRAGTPDDSATCLERLSSDLEGQ